MQKLIMYLLKKKFQLECLSRLRRILHTNTQKTLKIVRTDTTNYTLAVFKHKNSTKNTKLRLFSPNTINLTAIKQISS